MIPEINKLNNLIGSSLTIKEKEDLIRDYYVPITKTDFIESLNFFHSKIQNTKDELFQAYYDKYQECIEKGKNYFKYDLDIVSLISDYERSEKKVKISKKKLSSLLKSRISLVKKLIYLIVLLFFIIISIVLIFKLKTKSSVEEKIKEIDTVKVEQTTNIVTAVNKKNNEINAHEYVDLGLSVKWATCNVGAESPEDYGNYYAWGEVYDKSEYTTKNSKTWNVHMYDISGDEDYDVAYKERGELWRMPTIDEMKELKERCIWNWISRNGINGFEVIGPNGNSIFLPAGGYNRDLEIGKHGNYWTSSPNEEKSTGAYLLYFDNKNKLKVVWDSRYDGYLVRPVWGKSRKAKLEVVNHSLSDDNSKITDKDYEKSLSVSEINGHKYVDLGLSVKWATCNLGGNSPEDYGSHFAWGELYTKYEYTADNSSTYKIFMDEISGSKRYDVVQSKWGSSWRMPTRNEMYELENRCTWKWINYRGVNGYKITGPSGKSIFLPAAGHRLKSSLNNQGENGNYWTGTPHERSNEYSCSVDFDIDCKGVNWGRRYLGRSIRPVSD